MAPPQWLTMIPDLAAVFAVFVAAAGLIYTGKQLALARKATAAQLLLQIDQALREFDTTVLGLRDGSVKGDEPEVLQLMGAMERLHVLVTKGLVDPAEIDDLHGWRLEALLANEKVQAYVSQFSREWRRLTDLQQLLSQSRASGAKRRP